MKHDNNRVRVSLGEQDCMKCDCNVECRCQQRPLRIEAEERKPVEIPLEAVIFAKKVEEGPSKYFCNLSLGKENVPQWFDIMRQYMTDVQAMAYLMGVMHDHRFVTSRNHAIYFVRSLVVFEVLPCRFDDSESLNNYISTTAHSVSKAQRAISRGYKGWEEGSPGKKICIEIGRRLEKLGYPYIG